MHLHGGGARRLRIVGRINRRGGRVWIAWGLGVGGRPIALGRRRWLIVKTVVKLFLCPVEEAKYPVQPRGSPSPASLPQTGRPTWKGCWDPRRRSGRVSGCHRVRVFGSRSAASGFLKNRPASRIQAVLGVQGSTSSGASPFSGSLPSHTVSSGYGIQLPRCSNTR